MHQTVKKIVVLPVRVDLLQKQMEQEIKDKDFLEQRIEEANEIGRYFTDRLKTAILNYPNYPYKLLDKSEPDSFVVEFALVELNPTKISYNLLGNIAGFLVPGGGVIGRVAITG